MEAIVLLAATFTFSLFCFAPLKAIPGNPVLQSEFAIEPSDGPPPDWMLPYDDSYIFIRYAQQAHRGHPMQWNTGEASTGASSFLYPWILLPGQWLSDDIQGWSRWSRSVGFVGLWLLGVVTALFFRALGFGGPWPLATALAVVWSGPVAFGALAGMESALNAASLLLALLLWLRLSKQPTEGDPLSNRGRLVRATALGLVVSLLPLMRPENLLLTLLCAAAILFLPRTPLPRWTVPILLVPSLALAATNFALTGLAQPTAVVTKSWLGIAYPELAILTKLYLLGAWTEILPVYLGARSNLLWPPVGLLALFTTVAALWALSRDVLTGARSNSAGSSTLRNLRPLAVVWLVLVALAPMSSLPLWQFMRHHHSALVCAWVLAFAGAGCLVNRLAKRFGINTRAAQVVSLVPAALLLTLLSTWGGFYARSAIVIHHRHGPAAQWLERNSQDSVLLLNDAGFLSLAHDGPAIDVMGLGTPEMAKAYRHGAGSMIEAIARRRPLPTIAAANVDVFRVLDLLSTPLVAGLDPENQTLLTKIDIALIEKTALAVNGIDFADLKSESQANLRWRPPPNPYLASFALDLPRTDGERELQGCRPISQGLGIAIPTGTSLLRAVGAPLGDSDSAVGLSFDGPSLGEKESAFEVVLRPGVWSHFDTSVPEGATWVWLDVPPGGVALCLESMAFV